MTCAAIDAFAIDSGDGGSGLSPEGGAPFSPTSADAESPLPRSAKAPSPLKPTLAQSAAIGTAGDADS